MQENTYKNGKTVAPPITRVICYIDGFNLYFGMREKHWRKYYWLDIHKFAQSLLKPGQQLVAVRYFTSRVSSTPSDPDQNKRQNVYLEALATLPDTSLYFGHYLSKPVKCNKCGAVWMKQEEKMTDVNIAMELLVDSYEDRFDTAILVTADSDLTGPILKVRHHYPAKKVIVALPPARVSDKLKRTANGWINVGQDSLRKNQLPNPVIKQDGHELHRPVEWR